MVQRLPLIVRKVIRELLAVTHLTVQDLAQRILRELSAHLRDDKSPALNEVRDSMVTTPGKPSQ
eukprot:15567077-Heterocapsa_arctica.AAC.1